MSGLNGVRGRYPQALAGSPSPFPAPVAHFPGRRLSFFPPGFPILFPEFSGHSSLLSLSVPLPLPPAVPYPQALAVCVLPFFLAFFFYVASWTSTHNSFRLRDSICFTQRPLACEIRSLWPALRLLLPNLQGVKPATIRVPQCLRIPGSHKSSLLFLFVLCVTSLL